MSTLPVKTHRELLDARKPGFGMPGELYSRQDVFENDLDIFFHKHWILVAVTADIAEPGDVYTVDIGKASIIVVRDDDEQVRAYRNVCRHRGARLKEAGKSTVGMLVCPYHQWTYDLDGSLKHAKHMGKDFKPECRSLIPVHCVVVGTHVLVCLSEEAPEDIQVLAEVMGPRFAPFDLTNTRIAHELDYIENGNWKLVMENNRECYHCEGTHPELIVSYQSEDLGVSLEEMSEEQRASYDAYQVRKAGIEADWESDGLLYATVEHLADDAPTQFRTQRMIIAGSGESQTLDTKVACSRLLGNLTRRDLGDTHLWGNNAWTHVMSDHAMISWILPLSPDRTLVRTKWLVHKDAVEGVDYDLQRLTEVWVATTQQDANLVAITHSGTQDPGFEPGPYSQFTEPYVDQFARWYSTRLAAHGI
ncbi:aromatic ring-hydroxylating dioxygenase subunit alpha [Pseudomonas putida]|uniref:Aromatic ring-hydroxylating dioxygenase subunit alpha n=1 Tax=Pseudomonas putida TaxID=303 RepID=A0A4D6X7K2_PSEPU|nr:aromatic ring-hydroxylating dioxygenase subunit alpha [Pseudomonas putida]QCI11967.1 aromatic ring-hydroxylating dioxygenase subunit alpha [Pseudomonas putida]